MTALTEDALREMRRCYAALPREANLVAAIDELLSLRASSAVAAADAALYENCEFWFGKNRGVLGCGPGTTDSALDACRAARAAERVQIERCSVAPGGPPGILVAAPSPASPPCTVAGHAEALALADEIVSFCDSHGDSIASLPLKSVKHLSPLLDAYRAATTSRPQEEAEKLMREVFSPEHESPAYGDLLDGLADITKSPVRPVADAVLRLIDQRIAAALRGREGA